MRLNTQKCENTINSGDCAARVPAGYQREFRSSLAGSKGQPSQGGEGLDNINTFVVCVSGSGVRESLQEHRKERFRLCATSLSVHDFRFLKHNSVRLHSSA